MGPEDLDHAGRRLQELPHLLKCLQSHPRDLEPRDMAKVRSIGGNPPAVLLSEENKALEQGSLYAKAILQIKKQEGTFSRACQFRPRRIPLNRRGAGKICEPFQILLHKFHFSSE